MTLLRANSVFVGHNNRRHWCMHSSEIKYNVYPYHNIRGRRGTLQRSCELPWWIDGQIDHSPVFLVIKISSNAFVERKRRYFGNRIWQYVGTLGDEMQYSPFVLSPSARKGPLSVKNKAVSVTRRNLGKRFRQAFDYFCIAWTHASEDLGRRLRLIVLIKGAANIRHAYRIL